MAAGSLMRSVNAIALFCEDIREEKNDINTLIGILPDNVSVAPPSPSPRDGTSDGGSFLGKLAIYTRIHFDPEHSVGEVKVNLILSGGTEKIIPLGTMSAAKVDEARVTAKEKGSPYVGLIFRAVIGGFNPPIGVIKVEALIDGDVYLAGALNFIHSSGEATSSNDRPPPSEQ